MGAEFNYRIYPDSLGQKKIEQRWDDACEECLYENGHSYSGGIGMLRKRGGLSWIDKELSTYDEAYDYLSDIHEKWNPAIAVSYFDKRGDDKRKKKYWMIGGWCSS